MRKSFCILFGLVMTLPMLAQHLSINTKNTTLVVDAPDGGSLQFVYYGQKLNNNETEQLFNSGTQHWNAYPAYGMDVQRESAISVTHSDGNMTLDLKVASRTTEQDGKSTIQQIKPRLITTCKETC